MNYEIDLLKLGKRLLSFWWVLAIALLLGGIGGFAYARTLRDDTYSSSASIFIISKQDNASITQSEITASEKLVEPFITILRSNTVIEDDVLKTTGLGYSVKEINSMTAMTADNNVLKIVVKADNPSDAKAIANAFCTYGVQSVEDKYEGDVKVSILDRPTMPDKPDPKNEVRTAAVCGILLMLIIAAVIACVAIFDTVVHDEEDLEGIIDGAPIIGSIPSFDTSGKRSAKYGGYDGYYAYPAENGGKKR